MIGLVSLFGGLEMIDLGEAPASMRNFRGAAASAEVGGTRTNILPPHEVEPMLQLLLTELELSASEDAAAAS